MIDLFASIAELVGVPLGSDVAVDSVNQLDSLLGTGSAISPAIPLVHHSGRGAFALRQGKWKLIFGRGSDRVQPLDGDGLLYDLKEDPAETRDRWQEEPRIVKDLTAALDRIRRDGRRFFP